MKLSPKKWLLAVGCCLVCSLLMLIIYPFYPNQFFDQIMLVLIALVAITCPIFWRCPDCGKILPLSGAPFIHHCPFCGGNVD